MKNLEPDRNTNI